MKPLDLTLEIISRADKAESRAGVEAGMTKGYIGSLKTQGKQPSLDAMMRLLGVCGYALCAVPRDEIPPNALVIGDEDGAE